MMLTPEIVKILKGEAPMPPYFFALAPLGWAYSLVARLRAAMYDMGILRTSALPCKVISVGNITAGGTGKTPMVVYIAGLLKEGGLKPVVVTRGYKGESEGRLAVVSDGLEIVTPPELSGDEPAMLASSLPGVPVVMGSDRFKAGLLAVERFDPDVIVLDDGFQHLALKRDLNILLLDAARPFGNGYTFPAGYLREPAGAIKRADIAVLSRADAAGTGAVRAAVERISTIKPSLPVLKAAHRPKSFHGVWDGECAGLEAIDGLDAFAVSGIADPASFTLILNGLNAKITGSLEYPDHYNYRQADLTHIEDMARKSGAQAVITTEKDAVKLRMLRPCGLKTLALTIEMSVTEGGPLLKGLLFERKAPSVRPSS